jgi:hypothetical protein
MRAYTHFIALSVLTGCYCLAGCSADTGSVTSGSTSSSGDASIQQDGGDVSDAGIEGAECGSILNDVAPAVVSRVTELPDTSGGGPIEVGDYFLEQLDILESATLPSGFTTRTRVRIMAGAYLQNAMVSAQPTRIGGGQFSADGGSAEFLQACPANFRRAGPYLTIEGGFRMKTGEDRVATYRRLPN